MSKSNYDLMQHVDRAVVEREVEVALNNLTLATCRYEGARAVYLKFFKPKNDVEPRVASTFNGVAVMDEKFWERLSETVARAAAPSGPPIGKADLAIRTAWWTNYFQRQELLKPLEDYQG